MTESCFFFFFYFKMEELWRGNCEFRTSFKKLIELEGIENLLHGNLELKKPMIKKLFILK